MMTTPTNPGVARRINAKRHHDIILEQLREGEHISFEVLNVDDTRVAHLSNPPDLGRSQQ
jgi:hypothetical protein